MTPTHLLAIKVFIFLVWQKNLRIQ